LFEESFMPTRREFLTQSAAGMLAATSVRLSEASATDTDKDKETPMKTYKVPHTDLVVSRLAFGCAMLGMDWNDADFVAKTVPVIEAAQEQGVTFFDLADVYGVGKAELALREVLKARPGLRQKIVIQTKCGDRFTEGGSVDNSRAHILESVDGSLKRLGTDHLDVLLLHWPDSLVEPEEVAQAFDALKRAGKVRYFGVSNHNPTQIELLRKSVTQPLVINQIQLGLAHWYVMPERFKGALTHGDEGVVTLDYCRLHGMQIQAYSPLRAGSIAKPPNLLNPGEDASAEVKKAGQLLTDIAKKNDVSPAAIMLAWLLHHPAGIVPIVGTTKAEHVKENCAADRVELTREEWYSLLHAAAQTLSPQLT
jgi:predicted oxidoreductase